MQFVEEPEAEDQQRGEKILEKTAEFALFAAEQPREDEALNQEQHKLFERKPLAKQLDDKVKKASKEYVQHKTQRPTYELYHQEEQEQG